MQTIVEFLLWDNCKNNCKFCFLKNGNQDKTIVEDKEKKEIFNFISNFLEDSVSFKKGNHLLLCGGELFDTSLKTSEKEWLKLKESIVKGLLSGKIGEFYLNTNLLYDLNLELVTFLDIFKEFSLINKIHFTTSYDLVGRFRDSVSRNQFLENLIKLRNLYPTLPIFVNTILTKPLCTLIKEKDFSIKDFQDTYKVKLSVIPYIVSDESLAPSFSDVSQALYTIEEEIPGFLEAYVNSFKKDNPRKVFKYFSNSKKFLDVTAEKNFCGHSINFSRYNKDTKSCFLCDNIKRLEKLKTL